MVDQTLIEEIKEMQAKGGFQPSNTLKMIEFMKQIGEENEDIKEKLKNMDPITVQFVVTDVDYKYWVKLGDGKVEYAEGESGDATVTLKATAATWGSLGGKGIEPTHRAYTRGDLQVEGKVEYGIAYGDIFEMVMKEFPSD